MMFCKRYHTEYGFHAEGAELSAEKPIILCVSLRFFSLRTPREITFKSNLINYKLL